MAAVSNLENQLARLTEQLSELNTTTKEQFKQSKLGGNYNPFSSSFAAPAYSSSMGLNGNGGNAIRFDKVKGKFNPFSHNRLDGASAETSNLIYASPQDRIRSDSNQVAESGRRAMGLAEGTVGMLGMSAGSTAGQVVGAGVAAKIGGGLGLALSTLMPVAGLLVGSAVGATLGSSAFRSLSGSNQRIAANSMHKYMMENSFRFLNPNESSGTTNPLGAGFGYKDSRELSKNIALMTDDVNLNVGTLMDLAKSFSESDLMKGINSTKEYTKRFKKLTETAKTMGYLLNDSVEDAGKFMSDLQLRGFDTSKLTNQAAKMRNLSQFLGKDVTEVAQTAVEYASNNVAGSNMGFTVALDNQTYNTELMNEVQDGWLKRGDERFKAGYETIKNMGGVEAAASVYGKIMNAAMTDDTSMFSQSIMAGAKYDAASQSWSFDSQSFDRFDERDFNFNDGQVAAQNQLISGFTQEMKTVDPDFEGGADIAYSEFFANIQSIVGSMESSDQAAVAQSIIKKARKEHPEQFKGSSDKAVIMRTLQLDETSAELIVAGMMASEDGLKSRYNNNGAMAEYIANQRANDTGFVGDIKRFGAGVGNAIAGAGMFVTAPLQNLADIAMKEGTDFLFGDKDFDYQKEFLVQPDVVKKHFGDSSGNVDADKLGKNFYKEFEKSLLAEQKKGAVISKVLLEQVSYLAEATVQKSSAHEALSGEDYNVQRWTSNKGLGEYAAKNYDVIQKAAVENKISDQTLGYIGSLGNMSEDEIKKAAPKLKELAEEYGGNEILAVAAYERGKGAVDEVLSKFVDLEKAREDKDFTEFNMNSEVMRWSKEYAGTMEKSAGKKAVEWQGESRTTQSKSQATADVSPGDNARETLVGAIQINKVGMPPLDGDSVVDARMETLGIEIAPEMTKAEKEALVASTESAYASSIKHLESYLRIGANENFTNLPEGEKTDVLNAYLSQMAGKKKLHHRDEKNIEIIKNNFDNIVQGKVWENTLALTESEASTVNPSVARAGYSGITANEEYDRMNTTALKDLQAQAKRSDEIDVGKIEGAQKRERALVDQLKFEGKDRKETAEIKRAFTTALHSGDMPKLESMANQYNLTEIQRQDLLQLGRLKKDGKISPLAVDLDSIRNEHQERAEYLLKNTKHDYAQAQMLLGDLGISEESIAAMSVKPRDMEKMSAPALYQQRDDMIRMGISTLPGLSDAGLMKLLQSANFDQEELALLSNDDGSNNNALIINKDGSFSLNPDADSKKAAEDIVGFYLEKFNPAKDMDQKEGGEEKEKEEKTEKDLTKAASDILATMEGTTQVLVKGNKSVLKRQEELTRQLTVAFPGINFMSGATGI